MCGIAGLVLPLRAPFSGAEARTIVAAMTASLAHRGPDDSGVWVDSMSRCVLGHRRLSVIDPSPAGHQPFLSPDERSALTFNGEIYNFQDLRHQLAGKGVSFRTRTDTEVLAQALAFWGAAGIERLDGMFAFAAFDGRTGETLLARDPFGEKPLYFMALADRGLAFASELQALELVPGFDGDLDIDAMAEVLSFQYVGAPRSIYRSVQKLPPGHWMKIDAKGHVRIERYFYFEPQPGASPARSVDELIDEAEDILLRSLTRRLNSDVPLGAFLSGGVDSSTVCALVRRRLDRPLKTFSVGFRDHPGSEHEAAQRYAEILGTEHHTLLMEPHVAQTLPELSAVLDEPNGDSSCLPTYLLSEYARREVTVALSGDGGDELFGGYSRYVATLADAEAAVGGERGSGATYYGPQLLVGDEARIAGLFGFAPPEFGLQMAALRADIDRAEPTLIAAMRRHDTERYLPGAVLAKVDRMSMRHALEVRTPFLSVELARFAQQIPDHLLIGGSRSKILLREIAYRYLPRELVDLPKQGFGLPQSDWTAAALHGLCAELVEGDDGRLAECFGGQRVRDFMRGQRTAGAVSVYFLWSVLVLECWLRSRSTPRAVDLHTSSALSVLEPVDPPVVAREVAAGTFVLLGGGADDLSQRRSDRLGPFMERLVDIVAEGAQPTCADIVLAGATGSAALNPRSGAERWLAGSLVAVPDVGARGVNYEMLANLGRCGVTRVLVETANSSEQMEEWVHDPQTGLQKLRAVLPPRERRTRAGDLRLLGASGEYRADGLSGSRQLGGSTWSRETLSGFFQPDDGADFRLRPGDPVVVCTHGLTPGGAERQWIILAEVLRNAGYDVTFLTLTPLRDRNAEYLPLLDRLGIPLFDATLIDDLALLAHLPVVTGLGRLITATGTELTGDLARVISVFTRLQPKAVFAQLDDPNLLCALAGRLCGISRIVMSFRNYNPTHFDWIDRPWYLPAYRLATSSGAVRLTGNSHEANADYAAWIGVEPGRVHHIPNALDVESFPPGSRHDVAALRAALSLSADARVVLGVFRFYPEKDPFTFLEAARRMVAKIPDLRVLIAGDGPLRAAMEQQIAADGTGDRVRLLGDRKDIGTLMTMADVVLLTSQSEGMSNVAAEAQLMARPLVASNIPGIRNAVHEGKSAVLCPVGDAAAFAFACVAILGERTRADEMGRSGHDHARRSFAKATLADRYLAVVNGDD